ncbi:NYN domain-containing protein [Achromobacter aloeverae]|uniref:NYN domain protein n=1 Tax=Achromobacter aloeverae TaxID=1750518 RepID=A0A4Q1HF21_9BURK|nr:NYN domain-containing protein [Achromobacter aloeverae]RXN85128.1 NYN domain protein [Achromobacter aloeverae]
MVASHENVSMALFCDFENVALGVRDANYEKLDIRLVLEKLLLKGSIVIKKAYCDWDRYKGFKAAMHEANFELIEIPHVRQSGKNSADIRLVVDALDLCYTKSHLDTFVIISGDSDFSPLVSKLRENAKYVIGVGVKQSTSDLLIANCDEFIFYDDLVRETQRSAARRDARDNGASRRSPEDERRRKEEMDGRRSTAIELAVETFDALVAERGDSGKIWASALKDAIKRRKPDFNESYYGFRAFGNLLEEARARGLLEIGRDEKSGTFVYRGAGAADAAGAGESDTQAARNEGRNEGRQDGRSEGRGEGRGQDGRRKGRERGAGNGRRDDARNDMHNERRDADRAQGGAEPEDESEGRPGASAGRSRPRPQPQPQPPTSDTEIAALEAPFLPTGAPADTGLMDDPTPAVQDAGAKPARKRHPVPARTAKAAAKKAAQDAARQPEAPESSATADLFTPAPIVDEAAANESAGNAAAVETAMRRTEAEAATPEAAVKTGASRRGAGRRTTAAKKSAGRDAATAEPTDATQDAPLDTAAAEAPAAKRAPRKTTTRARRPRKDDAA